MSLKEIPLSELLMQEPEAIVDLTSPLNSVDQTSRDMLVIQEELEKRLKQRAGRQDLVERNILPPLSFPTAPKLFTNSQQLQRAQIADHLQKRMRNRPARDNLMQMNILPDLQLNIDPALQATQLQLRKSKLADSLNDKLANRPGPLQLLQNGIIEPHLSEVVKGYELDQTKGSKETPSTSEGGFAPIPEISLYSGEGFNTQHSPLMQRHSIPGTSPSPADVHGMDVSPGPGVHESSVADTRKFSDSSISPAPSPVSNYEDARSPEKSPRGFNSTYPPLLRTSLSSGMLSTIPKAASPGIGRKKQPKKYRKLRYHEYVPPSKSTPKGGKTNPKPPSKSDSPYSSLLQQQQLFLQLQVLQQQYPNGVLMQKLPDMLSSMSKEQQALAFAAAKGMTVTSPTDITLSKQASIPQVLPVELPNKHNASSIRFDELKVSDLKSACKELGMIVSGKKAELVERLMDQNKGTLPAVALPDNLPRDGRRQAYSQGNTSSLESQFSSSSVLSPGSPTNTSPVFKFPSERGSHDGGNGSGGGGGSVSAGMGVNKLPNLVKLPEVLPAANLHKEINEIIERQKRNYIICQKSGVSEKSIAPRPELSDLLAIKLPSYTTSTVSKGGSNGRQVDARTQAVVSEKSSSRSLPASPKSSPANTPSSSSGCGGYELSLKSSSATSTSNTGMGHNHGLISIPTSGHGDILVNRSQPVGGAIHPVSIGVSTLATSYYQQQQPVSSQAAVKQSGMRPGRASVPAQTHGMPHMGPPSYTSVMRSRSIAGPHPNLIGMDVMHNGVSYVHDMTGMATPPNEMSGGGKALSSDLFVSDSLETAMDTGESSISDIFDILRAEGEEFSHASQPASLPGLSGNHAHHPRRSAHSSLPQTPQYGGVPGKSSLPHDPSQSSHYMQLGNIMPFGNPSLTSQNKSGSDVCLNLVEGREGQKNSTGSSGLYANVLGNELNWLDLDNSNLGLSPTLPGGTFGNLNTHSNPGSLPHDQFQNSFMEDGMGGPHSGMIGGMVDKSSNPAMNGYGGTAGGGGMQSYLDSNVMQHTGLYPTDEDRLLVQELGLSTS